MADATINIKALDNTQAGFASAKNALKKFSNSAKQTTKGLLGTITGTGLGSALGTALGVNLQSIADNVARAFTGMSKEAEEAFRRIEDLSTETADIFEKRMRLRRTDAQELEDLKNKELSLEKQIADAQKAATAVTVMSGRRHVKTTVQTEEALANLMELQNEQEKVLYDIALLNKRKADEEQRQLESLKTKLEQVNDEYKKAESKLSGVTLKGRDQLESLRAAWSRLTAEVTAMGEPQTVEGLERLIELTKELTGVSIARATAEEQAKEGQREAAKILGEGFETAIVSGEKFSDVLKQLGKDLMQLLIRRQITEPLIDALGGSGGGGGFFGFLGGLLGKATGGPVSRGSAYMVGENGPEMFIPTQSGNIVSNERMSGIGGSKIYIDAKGADPSAIQRLWGALAQLDASVEPRSLAVNFDRRMRGGAFARS